METPAPEKTAGVSILMEEKPAITRTVNDITFGFNLPAIGY